MLLHASTHAVWLAAQGVFCGDCLFMRYGENITELAPGAWVCPPCRGLCNCSFHRIRAGWAPTGTLYRRAIAEGARAYASTCSLHMRLHGSASAWSVRRVRARAHARRMPARVHAPVLPSQRVRALACLPHVSTCSLHMHLFCHPLHAWKRPLSGWWVPGIRNSRN